MKLYHWTNVTWLEAIMELGLITLTDSMLAGPSRAEFGKDAAKRYGSQWTLATEPKVVWLSNNPVPDETYLGMVAMRDTGAYPIAEHQLPPEWDKRRVRITVEVPDGEAEHGWWPRWARAHRIREAWYQHIAEGHRSPKEWFVVQRAIPLSDFVAIDIDGEQVWPKPSPSALATLARVGGNLKRLLGL